MGTGAAVQAALEIAQPLAVHPQGMTMTTWAIISTLPVLLGILTVLVRMRPTMRKLQNENDVSLRHDLMQRITGLENELREERKTCDEKIRRLEERIDKLTQQVIAAQVAAGRAVHATHDTPAADAAIDRLLGQAQKALDSKA